MVGVSSAAVALAVQTAAVASFYRDEAARGALPALVQAVQQHYAQRQTYPDTLDALAATPGFEHVRLLPLSARAGYAVTPSSARLADGVWQFDRAAAFVQDARYAVSEAQYLAADNNTCDSSAGFATAPAWCGTVTSRWVRVESRNTYPRELGAMRIGMARTLQKFADAYSAALAMPSGGLTPGGSSTLRALVNYPAGRSAAECYGVWLLPAASPSASVALDCTDLFTRAGADVTLNYHAPNRVSLAADSAIRTATGQPVVVAVDLAL
jgi:hypothetical protein